MSKNSSTFAVAKVLEKDEAIRNSNTGTGSDGGLQQAVTGGAIQGREARAGQRAFSGARTKFGVLRETVGSVASGIRQPAAVFHVCVKCEIPGSRQLCDQRRERCTYLST